METWIVNDILMTQLHVCLVTEVAWQMVLVLEVVCANLALLCQYMGWAVAQMVCERLDVVVSCCVWAKWHLDGLSDVHKFPRELARCQFNKNYEDLNASGAQQWGVFFRAVRWFHGCLVDATSRR